MNYLLDTHTVLWLARNSTKLSEPAKTAIFDMSCRKFVSMASAWELAVKISIGKFRLVGGVAEFFRIIEHNGFIVKDIERKHIILSETLPFHHRDPFDRILVCTALAEGFTIISADDQIYKYAVPYIW